MARNGSSKSAVAEREPVEEVQNDIQDPVVVEGDEHATVEASAGVMVKHDPVQVVRLSDHFEITRTGFQVLGEPLFEHFEQMGEQLHVIDDGLKLVRGDFQRMTEARFGEKASQILDAENGWATKESRVDRWVAERVPVENRLIPPLTWSHLQAVAALDPAKQRRWLERASAGAEDGVWSVSKLKTAMTVEKAGGERNVQWLLVIDCQSEAKQTALGERLLQEGYIIVKAQGAKKKRADAGKTRAKKAKGTIKAKKASAAKAHRSFPKISGMKRVGKARGKK